MANLIVDEGNTLCKIAVLDKSEVLCEWSDNEFDMAKATEFVEQFSRSSFSSAVYNLHQRQEQPTLRLSDR